MAKHSGPSVPGSFPAVAGEPIGAIYDELIRNRERLSHLPPLVAKDLAPVKNAMHEVVWFFLTPGATATLKVPDRLREEVARAARDRSRDIYTILVSAIALKLSGRRAKESAAILAEDIRDGIDSLAFDFRATKAVTLTRLLDIKAHLEERIAYVRQSRRKAFRFQTPPEKYRDRAKKSETPERFLLRVYGSDLKRGLTQADIRDADPAFYNVLHVWCSRRGKKMANLVPASRARAR